MGGFAPQEGLFFIDKYGRERRINPASPGVLGNRPELYKIIGDAPYSRIRGVVDAYLQGDDQLARDGIQSIRENYYD